MLEQSSTSFTVIFSSRRGELAELVTTAGGATCAPDAAVGEVQGSSGAEGGRQGQDAGGASVGSLDDFDGIVVVGGDGTFFEVNTLASLQAIGRQTERRCRLTRRSVPCAMLSCLET